MLKVAICDDDSNIISNIQRTVSETACENGIQVEFDEFVDGTELVNAVIHENTRFDLIFLDIEMKNLDGLETARKIREIDELVYLIYVTSHKSYAIEAYEVHPFQFIVKPLDDELVKKYFLMVYEKLVSGAYYYEYTFKKDYYKVLVNDIVYFESDKRLINMYLADGTITTHYGKLNEVEEQLKSGKADFWRIHRSRLVNVRYIRKKAYDYIELFSGEELTISEDRRKELNERYITLMEREMN